MALSRQQSLPEINEEGGPDGSPSVVYQIPRGMLRDDGS
jgi:hypothetical protein